MSVILIIPVNPVGQSLNRWNQLHWAKKRKIKAEWTMIVTNKAKLAKVKFKRAEIRFTCFFGDRRTRDQDNFSLIPKLCMDGLTKSGMIIDDNSNVINLLPVIIDYDKLNPRVEIEIKEWIQ